MVNERSGADVTKRSTTTKLGHPRADLAVLLGGLPLLGAGLGLALPALARQLVKLPVMPAEKLVEFAGSLGAAWHLLVLAVLGAALGAGAGVIGLSESLVLTLDDTRLRSEGGGGDGEESLRREDVGAVFADGKELVVLAGDSRQLLRGEHAAPARKLAEAFRAHGWPWHESDPYADLWQRWIPRAPAAPAELDAILAARKEALKRKAKDDVRELSQSADRLGYALRDEGKDQFWRPLAC